MAGSKKIDKLIEQLISNQLEAHLTRLVRKSKKKAEREKGKLRDFLQLPLIKDEEIVDAEFTEGAKEPEVTVKKTGDGGRQGSLPC